MCVKRQQSPYSHVRNIFDSRATLPADLSLFLLHITCTTFLPAGTHHLVAEVKNVSVDSGHVFTVFYWFILFALITVVDNVRRAIIHDVRLADHSFLISQNYCIIPFAILKALELKLFFFRNQTFVSLSIRIPHR